jgi:hypothetical protein
MRTIMPLALMLLALAPPAAAQTMPHHHQAPEGQGPREAGQSAFAALAEVVALLGADPNTDWTRVDIAALREHLVDMDEVTLHARASVEPVPGGITAEVEGEGRTREAIHRMVPAHAVELEGMGIWEARAEVTPRGARLVVRSDDPAVESRIRGLGFFGLLAVGDHHQPHHLAIARGLRPHHP